MPKKFISCVKKVTKSEIKRYGKLKYNPYAICRIATNYFGTTHIGIIHRIKKKYKR